MRNKKVLLIVALLLVICTTFIFNVLAHKGRTDSSGGHWDNSTGTYHYHCGGYPAHSHTNGVCPYKKPKSNMEAVFETAGRELPTFDVRKATEEDRKKHYDEGYKKGYNLGFSRGYDNGIEDAIQVCVIILVSILTILIIVWVVKFIKKRRKEYQERS